MSPCGRHAFICTVDYMFLTSVGTRYSALQCKYIWTDLALCMEKRSDVIGVDKKVDPSRSSSSP